MKMRIYAIRDKLAKETGPLFEAKNDDVAMRNFDQVVQKTGKSEEFLLIGFGSIDHESDDIELYDKSEVIK